MLSFVALTVTRGHTRVSSPPQSGPLICGIYNVVSGTGGRMLSA